MAKVRPARLTDFPAIAQIFAKSFRQESYILFLHSKTPASEVSFATDLVRYWRRHIWPKWWSSNSHFVVSLDAKGNVVGAAVWEEPPSNRSRFWTKMMKRLATCLRWIDSQLFPDHTLDSTRSDAFERALPFFAATLNSHGPHWSLETLGVLPEAQKQGHGKALVAWGLGKAQAESVPVAVVCSAGSEDFYRKCGFSLDAGKVTEGDGNPLAEVEGGAILFWTPT